MQYAGTAINARLQAVINQIDAGAGNGTLKLFDAGNNILSTVVLQKPSGTIAAGVLTFAGLPVADPLATNSGVPTTAQVQDSAGNVIMSLSFGSDIAINPSNIVAGQVVAIQTATITGR